MLEKCSYYAYPKLIDSGYRILIYSGGTDSGKQIYQFWIKKSKTTINHIYNFLIVVPTQGTLKWIQ